MAKRLGYATGTIYGDDVNPSDIHECCKVLTKEELEEYEEDPFELEYVKNILHLKCLCCAIGIQCLLSE